jgi:hypothetical protein
VRETTDERGFIAHDLSEFLCVLGKLEVWERRRLSRLEHTANLSPPEQQLLRLSNRKETLEYNQ